MDPFQLWVAVIILLVLLAGCGALIRLVFWKLYVSMRDERDELNERFDALQEDRDRWREVAQRALLVAQIGRSMSKRAATLIVKESE